MGLGVGLGNESKPFTTHADGTGWISLRDSQYTAATPLVVPAGIATAIPNNTIAANVTTYAPMESPMWVVADRKFDPVTVGARYVVRLAFFLRTNQANHTMKLAVNVAGADFWANTYSIFRNSSGYFYYTVDMNFYCLGGFVANGAQFTITPTRACDMHTISMFISKVWSP